MTETNDAPITAAGTIELAGKTLNRIGYGAMRIVGQPGNWGEPDDRGASVAVLRRAVELGVGLIDTADAYGPGVSEELIAEALHPYPEDVVVATKGGAVKTGPSEVRFDGSREYLRRACEASLRRLRVEAIDLYQLHWPDPDVPFEESVGALAELREEGKVRYVGVSNVSVEQLEAARGIVPVASVQNPYNLSDRSSEGVLAICEREGIAFLPYGPLGAAPYQRKAPLAAEGGPLEGIARRRGATPGQVALAWLLRRSPNIVPIPGTTSIPHLEENVAAASLGLTDEDLGELGG